MGTELDTVLEKVRRSLGRTSALTELPVPPIIPDAIARLGRADMDLPALFRQKAGEMKMMVSVVDSDTLFPRLSEFLTARKVRRVMLSNTPMLTRWKMTDLLNGAGFDARWWSDLSLDDTYEFDAGLTEVDYAVAETGTLAIRHRPEHGRLLSLVPFVHVAIIEHDKFVPDLIDLFDVLKRDGTGSGVTMISGPRRPPTSK